MDSNENKILDAMEIVAEKYVNEAGYDRTIQATIFELVNKSLGEYKVKYQDSYFSAFSADTDIEYAEGTSVYILIPQGDISKDKTILGAVDGYKIQGITAITDADASDIVGYNCIKEEETYELCSYIQEQNIILYDKDNHINLVGLDNIALKNFLSVSSTLVAGASFKTQLPGEQRLKGNYGIIFELGFKTETSDEIVLKKFIVDINKMVGNPYSLNNFTLQLGYFEIDGENFEYVNNITIFEKDFPNQDIDKNNDIFISEVQIFGANRISQEEYNVARLVINTPQGNYFSESDSLDTIKQLVAKIKINGNELDLSKSKVDYYWFKENDDITIESMKYNYYGGEGWECLNNYTLLDNNNPDLVSWSPASNIKDITKANITSEKVQYKCIAVYNDTILSKQIEISNHGSPTSISIISDSGANFIDSLGYPTLTCKINNFEEPLPGYRYAWSKVDNNGLYTRLYETTNENEAYQIAYNNLANLNALIDNEEILPNAAAAEKEEYTEALNAFEIVTRVDKNKIYNINVAEITNYMQYKCSVYYDGEYVGTESIVLYNNKSNNQDYFIELINGTQVFKYDENGLSPCDSTKNNPQEILPISFNIINKEGLDVTEEMLEKSQIEWIVPEDNTLIITNGVLSMRDLVFTIDSFYDKNKTNNEIQLIITYKGQRLTAYTNLSFIKEGDIGTNGTDYYCVIVPNTDEYVDYPAIENGVLNFTPAQEGKWFKAQIWKNGKCIFNYADSQNSSEGNRATIRWGIQKNKYRANRSDPSSITVLNNIFSTTGYYTGGENEASSPANIVQCRITYKQVDYYATLPIITTSCNQDYKIKLKSKTGFNYVTYSSDGRYPKYNDNKPFEIEVFETIDGFEENISLLASNEYRVNFEFLIKGQIYDVQTDNWVNKILFTEDDRTGLNKNQIKLIPSLEYSGECVSTGLECICKKSDNVTEIGRIHIPIHCIINRYANSAINGWDGNSVAINEEDGYILTPQIGAGIKDENNRFTGMVMGSVKDNSNNGVIKTGLLGYDAGQQSLFLDSESGGAIFGKPSIDIENNKPIGGQIIIDPQSNKSYLFSRDYWNSYNDKGFPTSYEASNMTGNGLLIDLATPQIKYGDGTKFGIDQFGNLTCRNLINNNGILSIFQLSPTTGLCGWSVSYDAYDNGSTYYFTKAKYSASVVAVSCFIPDNFVVEKAQAIITTVPSVAPLMVDSMGVNETASSFDTSYVWGINSTIGSGYTHKVPTMQLAMYALPDTAFYSAVGGAAFSDVFWSESHVDLSVGTKLKSFSGFTDLDNRSNTPNYYNNYYGAAEMKTVDITTELKQYLAQSNTNICRLAVGPDTVPSDITLQRTSISGGYQYTPRLTAIESAASHTNGEVTLEVFLYGYYKMDIND